MEDEEEEMEERGEVAPVGQIVPVAHDDARSVDIVPVVHIVPVVQIVPVSFCRNVESHFLSVEHRIAILLTDPQSLSLSFA